MGLMLSHTIPILKYVKLYHHEKVLNFLKERILMTFISFITYTFLEISEAFDSELLKKLERFLRYYIHSIMLSMFKFLITQYRVTRSERDKTIS